MPHNSTAAFDGVERADGAPGCTGCSRRDFLSNSMLLAASALLAAACGDGQIGAGGTSTGGVVTGPTGSAPSISLADYPALATVGGVARMTVQGTPVAVVRSATATYIAFSLRCPHQGTTVSQVSGGFRCPNHGATFNASGTWTGGQRTSSLYRITTTLDTTAGTLTFG